MFTRFLPFWFFVLFFKFAGNIHYDLTSPFGEQFFPLWLVGLIMGGGSLVQVILDVPAGHIMDRFGYRRFLKLGCATFIFAGVCFMFGLTSFTYVLSYIVATFGWLFFGPGINAYCLSHASKGNAGKFMSLKDMSGSAGVVLTSIVLPFIFIIPPHYVGAIIVGLFLIAFISISFAPKDIERAHETHHKLPDTHHHYVRRHFLRDTLKAIKRLNPASSMLLLSNVAGATFYGAIWFVVPLVLAKQVENQFLSLGLGIFDFSIIVLGVLLGNIADKYNRRKLVFLGLLLFGVSAMLSGLNFTWLFIIFGFLATAGDEMSQLSLWSWLHTLDTDHARDGAVSGVVNVFNDIGWALGPILAGLLYGFVGPSWTIMICAAPIIVVWIVYQCMVHKHKPHIPEGAVIPAKPHRPRHRT